jgi:hypothetical protein
MPADTLATKHPIVLLKAAIGLSKLSDRVFATNVMGRDERTIRRWLSGDTPIPDAAIKFLERYVADA